MSVSLFHGIRWMPSFFVLCLHLVCYTHCYANEVVTIGIEQANYAEVREELIHKIEENGLVLGEVSQFAAMLQRTAPAVGASTSPYQAGEVLHFCSAKIAWQLAQESPDNIALCPLGIALYELKATPKIIYLSYRALPPSSLGRQQANALLAKIVQQVVTSLRP